ncbi:hypothetical protein GLAREA_02906 [Glarea lozoyensis ATCC 20868]|uniref:THUMP domain-containing protein n=1 Tax=Glarea lozoyensis (strain ATCC 20868 / MF5171) TaxID=1116229 RepID=S3CKE1_GLAL2|nr:uncharacterized protein GLAREA_02906 [Glarea lozoyensis ATCC 20868]EPE26992.1 hypothetical protein GLAREA_02906 [Glarea lozoyensis ATCC 20868]
MAENKRKAPTADDRDRGFKRSKGGPGGTGKWQTPNHKAKSEAFSRGHGTIAPGDAGIWATCARRMEGRATTELKALLYQYAEKFYGLTEEGGDEEDEDLDIEAAIKKETAALTEDKQSTRLFSAVRIDIECVMFFRVQPSIDPVDLCHRIALDISSNPDKKLTRYVNRISPMTLMGKANEKGLEEVTTAVLKPYFQLNGQEEYTESEQEVKNSERPSYTYSIRPTIRNHNTLKRDVVIEKIASSIGDMHKVNLTKPDKVIIVEIYQTVCGMSVVDGDWEDLKRYNLAELYTAPSKKLPASEEVVNQENLKKSEVSTAAGTDSVEPN